MSRPGRLPSIALATLAGGLALLLAGCQSVPYASLPSPGLPPVVDASTPPPPAPSLRAIDLLPADIADRAGWARDIDTAFTQLGIPASAGNLCAAMAVIEQESSWHADPAVLGLAKIVRKEIDTRAARFHIPPLLVSAALKTTSPDGRSYQQRIAALRTEGQANTLFEDLSAELPLGRTLLAGFNPIRTGGPMQVSIAFAEQHLDHRYPYPRRGSVRHEVFTRRGGLYFGIANLLDYPADSPHPRYRFADFNAGRHSSRNAAFQAAVAQLTGRTLALDGDLLRYADGRSVDAPSHTEAALHSLATALHLSHRQIRADLTREKAADFADSRLYQRVFALADKRSTAGVPRQRIPEILLKSPKIQRKLTTRWFAQRVESRYNTCMTRAR
ncbi:MAG: DUF1615 domain-containing protein [Rhodocyclaceae bacterium]|nr:DUF1615 domain-containing protein [Rhodocyclaceae bacterium]